MNYCRINKWIVGVEIVAVRDFRTDAKGTLWAKMDGFHGGHEIPFCARGPQAEHLKKLTEGQQVVIEAHLNPYSRGLEFQIDYCHGPLSFVDADLSNDREMEP